MKFNVDDLIEQGLVKKKTYTEGEYKGLSVLKYTRKVFYKNLWHLDSRLLECRGIVVDEDDNVIVLPFKKVFNFGENNTGIDIPCSDQVEIVRKMNGFMAAATLTKQYGLLVSTTGTLDSEYAEMARKWIEHGYWQEMVEGVTYLFEICDNHDPHIIHEKAGAYLIGVRNIETCELESEHELNMVALSLDYLRPPYDTPRRDCLCNLKERMKECRHEGFMIRAVDTGEVLFKWKSPHYLSKKALMRVGKAKVDILYDNKAVFKRRLDEEFYDFVDYLVENIDKYVWRNYNDQQRRKVIEEYYYD